MIHCPGDRLPGTWPLPEEARLEVFLPYMLLREQPALRAAFAHVVQYFAQYVATLTMERWERAKILGFNPPEEVRESTLFCSGHILMFGFCLGQGHLIVRRGHRGLHSQAMRFLF